MQSKMQRSKRKAPIVILADGIRAYVEYAHK